MDNANNARQVFGDILSRLQRLNGADEPESDSRVRLGMDARHAAILAAADAVEKRVEIEESLVTLLNDNAVTTREVISELLKRKIEKALFRK